MSAITATPSTDHTSAAGAALAHLFDDHGRMVLGICRIYLNDEYEAEDAAQETFVSAHRSLLSGSEPHQTGPWLAAIARNECRDRIRGLARRNTTPAPQENFERIAAVGHDTLAEDIDRDSALQTALADLPESQREAFVLREMFGMRYDEIASALETTDAAVESLLVRARRALRDHLTSTRLAPVALVVPFALRESLAHAVAGFPLAPAAGGAAAVSGGGLASAGAGAHTGVTQAGAGQIGGAATSGSVGTSAGTGSALGTTAATSAATTAASGAAGLAGVAKVLATPILAKLAIAGAATTMVATAAVSKPWNVEAQSPTPAAASEESPPVNTANGVAGVKAELAANDAGFAAGAGQGISDGTNAAKRRSKKDKNETQGEVSRAHGKSEGGANPAASAPRQRANAPASKTPAADPAEEAITVAKAPETKPAPEPTDDLTPEPPGASPPNPADTTADEPTDAGESPTSGRADNPSADTGIAKDGDVSEEIKAEPTGGGPEATPVRVRDDVAASDDDKRKRGRGKKRGHEADGPGSSDKAPGKNKSSD